MRLTLDRDQARFALAEYAELPDDEEPTEEAYEALAFDPGCSTSTELDRLMVALRDGGAILLDGSPTDCVHVYPNDDEDDCGAVIGAWVDGMLVSRGRTSIRHLARDIMGRSGFELMCEIAEGALRRVNDALASYEAARQPAVDPMMTLEKWIGEIYDSLVTTKPASVSGPFGQHGVLYDEDEDGDSFATIGMNLPRHPIHVFAEIEDGTYGSLQGLRVYLSPRQDRE